MLILFDVLFDLFGEGYVGAVTGTIGDDAGFDRVADQG
jgi:hypothetical protein